MIALVGMALQPKLVWRIYIEVLQRRFRAGLAYDKWFCMVNQYCAVTLKS